MLVFISVTTNLASQTTVLRLREFDRMGHICLCFFQLLQIYQAKLQYLGWD